MKDMSTRGRWRRRLPARPRAGRGEAVDPSLAEALVRKILDVGIDGMPGFDPAHRVAETARRDHPDTDRAIRAVIASHRRLVAAGGFLTGLGGFVTMPAALPANVIEFYVVTARMAAAVATLRGYDIDDPAVRTAILLTLVDGDPAPVLRRAGVVGSGRVADLAAGHLPTPARMMVDKAIGFRLIRQFGERMMAGLGRGVPLAGGVVGAGFDVYLFGHIAASARTRFPPR